MTIDIDKLEVLAKAAPGGQWEVWTSNSWRRVLANQFGRTVRVIEPTVQRHDNHPDLTFGEGVAEYLEGVTPDVLLDLIAEVRALRETIKRQASAARAGMDAAKAGGAIMLELATQARAESSPDVLASERAMNAMLTEENEALREDAERWRTEMALRNDPEVAIIYVGLENRCRIYRNGEAVATADTYADAIDAARGVK